MTEKDRDEKIAFYVEQKRACTDNPESVLNRIFTATEGVTQKVSQ